MRCPYASNSLHLAYRVYLALLIRTELDRLNTLYKHRCACLGGHERQGQSLMTSEFNHLLYPCSADEVSLEQELYRRVAYSP